MPTKNPDASIATIEEEESSFYDYNTGVNNPTTCYYYDGQMSICESYTGYQGENFVMDQTRNTLGARGIDMIEAQRVDGPSGDTVMAMGKRQSSPIYDGHGNMMATLVKNGSSYSLQNKKRYDPWGGFTVGSGPGSGLANPSEAYCANLGHKSDAESDFIYMRARYYEPGSGRFISEDPAMDGWNWYGYCNNNPVNRADATGKWSEWSSAMTFMGIGMILAFICGFTDNIKTAAILATIAVGAFYCAMELCEPDQSLPQGSPLKMITTPLRVYGNEALTVIIIGCLTSRKAAEKLPNGAVMAAALFTYSMLILACIAACDIQDPKYR